MSANVIATDVPGTVHLIDLEGDIYTQHAQGQQKYIVLIPMSFAMEYGVTPWVTDLGLQNAFIVAAARLVQCSTVFIMIKWGKQFREKRTGKYNQYVAEMAKAGMAH